MAVVTTSGTVPKDRTQIGQTATGVLVENFNPVLVISSLTPTSQAAYGCLLGLRAGDSVTGVLLRAYVAAAGSSATTVRSGIADSTGKILAISGNLNTAASWVAGPLPLAFAAPFTVPSDGGYYACFVVNGTWGTTAPTLGRVGAPGSVPGTAFGAFAAPGFVWAGQTDLPAVNSSIGSFANGNNQAFYMAFY